MLSRMRSFPVAAFLFAGVHAIEAAPTRIDLYTMGPGDDLFSKFGHVALCVVGDELPADGLCYNYGTSDFSRPVGLGWEVVRGRARFWVSVSDRQSMIDSFAAEDRAIYRQRLPLSEKQAERLASTLERDALPENREYVYNHFLENCSTRPRDHIDAATGGDLRRVRLPSVGTYRDYATEGLSRASTLLVPASDFLLGRWVDRRIDAYAAMFIPDVLRAGVASAFEAAPETIYERRGSPIPSRVDSGRKLTWIASFLAVAAFAASLFLGARSRRFFRNLGGGLLGTLGGVLLFAAAVSVLPELRRNELLLVFFPLDFFLLSSNRAFVVSYSTMRLAVLAIVAVLATAGVLLQPLWPFWFLSASILGAIRVGASGESSTRAQRERSESRAALSPSGGRAERDPERERAERGARRALNDEKPRGWGPAALINVLNPSAARAVGESRAALSPSGVRAKRDPERERAEQEPSARAEGERQRVPEREALGVGPQRTDRGARRALNDEKPRGWGPAALKGVVYYAAMSQAIDRREAMKRLGASAMLPLVARFHPAVPPQEGGFRPAFLEEGEVATVADLAERIIPQTETPGAREALVHQYIDWVLSRSDEEKRGPFREGLRALEGKCGSLFGKKFAELEAAEQDQVLASIEAEPFFQEAKRLTIDGYYRSEVGMKRELGFEGNTFLSEFEGCNHPEHKSWTPQD